MKGERGLGDVKRLTIMLTRSHTLRPPSLSLFLDALMVTLRIQSARVQPYWPPFILSSGCPSFLMTLTLRLCFFEKFNPAPSHTASRSLAVIIEAPHLWRRANLLSLYHLFSSLFRTLFAPPAILLDSLMFHNPRRPSTEQCPPLLLPTALCWLSQWAAPGFRSRSQSAGSYCEKEIKCNG